MRGTCESRGKLRFAVGRTDSDARRTGSTTTLEEPWTKEEDTRRGWRRIARLAEEGPKGRHE